MLGSVVIKVMFPAVESSLSALGRAISLIDGEQCRVSEVKQTVHRAIFFSPRVSLCG